MTTRQWEYRYLNRKFLRISELSIFGSVRWLMKLVREDKIFLKQYVNKHLIHLGILLKSDPNVVDLSERPIVGVSNALLVTQLPLVCRPPFA